MSNIKSYLKQNYDELRKHHLKEGTLFRDDQFPAEDCSISLLKKDRKDYKVYWKRPRQIVADPKFIVNGIDPNDLVQGDTGNCWFISAASTLASLDDMAKYVIPVKQTFNESEYAGIFFFRFWRFGSWISVVVDDKLPVNEQNELIYCQNQKDKNEFFGPLLEKAYAKLNGCYEFLNFGDPTDALTDLTGAVCENFDITKCLTETSQEDDEEDDEEEEDEDDEDDEQAGYQSTDLKSLWVSIHI